MHEVVAGFGVLALKESVEACSCFLAVGLLVVAGFALFTSLSPLVCPAWSVPRGLLVNMRNSKPLYSASASRVLIAVLFFLCATSPVRSSHKPAVPVPVACADALLVFEYDGQFDWEVVHMTDARTMSAVEWMRSLPDRLTQSSVDSAGQELMVHSGP